MNTGLLDEGAFAFSKMRSALRCSACLLPQSASGYTASNFVTTDVFQCFMLTLRAFVFVQVLPSGSAPSARNNHTTASGNGWGVLPRVGEVCLLDPGLDLAVIGCNRCDT